MEKYCSTGQNPQRAVAPTDEDEVTIFRRKSETMFRCSPKENCFWWLSGFSVSSSANVSKSHL